METIKKVKQMIADGVLKQEDAEKYIPELKESEDEKIRKEILSFLNGTRFTEPSTEERVKWISWLEKQGEKKHQYNSRPRYVGEEELLGANKQGKCPFSKQELIDKGFAFNQDGDLAYPIHKIEKKEFVEWSEEDDDMLYKVTVVINRLCAEGKEYVWSINTLKKLFYWLKSLRPQSKTFQCGKNWKPTEEQLKALQKVVDEHWNIDGDPLWELCEQLKTL